MINEPIFNQNVEKIHKYIQMRFHLMWKFSSWTFISVILINDAVKQMPQDLLWYEFFWGKAMKKGNSMPVSIFDMINWSSEKEHSSLLAMLGRELVLGNFSSPLFVRGLNWYRCAPINYMANLRNLLRKLSSARSTFLHVIYRKIGKSGLLTKIINTLQVLQNFVDYLKIS